ELLQKLFTTRFIGVVGSSGCGKSSLIKAGLIPKLKAGFLTNERDHWITASMRPAGNPLAFLAESLSAALGSSQVTGDENRSVSDSGAPFLNAIHENGTQGITDILLPVFEKSPCNLLLLVDQFEELFTTKRNNADAETQTNENILFVNILLSLSRQKNLPVYVVITMRSDYIGNCNKFYGLPETLNEGQYLVPRLNRQQLNEVIELPIKLSGEKMSARLLDQILNDSDKDLDQLPVLQHALMRTYKFWLQGNQSKAIDFENYEAGGKLDNALSNHANEVYGKLDSTQKNIAELVFRSLTDVNAENVPIRRRQSLAQLTEVCSSIKNSSMPQVEAVINKFRERDCAFLTPFSGKLKESTIIDISHESLMRQWDKLIGWMKDEQTSGRKFKWLTESVNNRREYLRGIDLKDALVWKVKQPANEEWALRYGGNYKVIETYIENSKRKARNSRHLRNAIIGIFIIAPLIVFALINQKEKRSLAEKDAITKEFTYSLELKNDTLKKKLLELDSSLANQKQLQFDLESSYEKEKMFAIIKTADDMKAERLKDENERKDRIRKLAERNREELEALKSSLRKEPFYIAVNKLNEGNTNNADAIVTALVDSYNKDKREFNNFREAITQVFQAKEIAQENPVAALRLSKKAWQNSKHPIIDSTITKQIPNKIYYKQQILPADESNFENPTLFISADKKSFAVNNVYNQIYTGGIGNDNLTMDEAFTYSYKNSLTENSSTDTYPLSKVFSVHNTSIIGLETEGNLAKWSNNKRIEIGAFGEMDKSKLTVFSPDQRYMVTAPGQSKDSIVKDSAVVLWTFSDMKPNAVPVKTILDSNNILVKQIIFSPNSRQYLVLDSTSDLKIYNIGKTIPVTLPNIAAAQFSEQGNYIITLSAFSRSYPTFMVRDSIGGTTKFKSLRLDYNDSRYLNGLISFSLSPDWKKIMFKQDAKISILEKETRDSIIKVVSSDQASKLKLSAVYSISDKTFLNTTTFIDSNSILSVNDKGTIWLWKTYAGFEHTDEALKNIQLPDLTIAEKLEEGSLTFNEIKSNEKEHDLREAASYFEKKYYGSEELSEKNRDAAFNNAKALYKTLIGKTEGEKRLYYIDKFTSFNRSIADAASPDNTKQRKMISQYIENVELLEDQAKNYSANTAFV
ncbi:MAG: hypothetical protein JWR72_1391, partial [Flavisolibacter sp.]|nr:hypothetical protein [Flavisolibacter sp.]